MPVADGVFTRFFSQKSLNTNATIEKADSGDSAYRASCSFTDKEKDPLRLYLQSGELCRARLTSPLDLLTGYSYFGARYLEHDLMTGWLSVDPMADKYPSLSPYAYCAWNPVKLVDPDGNEFDPTTEKKYINPYEAEICARMELIDNIRNSDKWDDSYEEQYVEYSKILAEINKMRDDKKNIYSVRTGVDLSEHGANTYGLTEYVGTNSKGQRKIRISLSTKFKNVYLFLGVLSHELKHAYQYYDKRLGFVVDEQGRTIGGNDSKELEREAFTREDMFSSNNVKNGQIMRFNYNVNPKMTNLPPNYDNYSPVTNISDYIQEYGNKFIHN